MESFEIEEIPGIGKLLDTADAPWAIDVDDDAVEISVNSEYGITFTREQWEIFTQWVTETQRKVDWE